MEELAWLHVDVDPTKRPDLSDEEKVKHIAAERARILPMLQDFKPAPTLIIDSGGGFQALWRLVDPPYIGGNITAAEEAEAYNQQLEILLGGDSCHNCDRIFPLRRGADV